jgi:hypothetical protein
MRDFLDFIIIWEKLQGSSELRFVVCMREKRFVLNYDNLQEEEFKFITNSAPHGT